MRPSPLLCCLLALAGCRARQALSRPPDAAAVAEAPRALQRCFPGDEPTIRRTIDALLDRAAALLDARDAPAALACAEEAARLSPDSVEAHHDRALALQDLRRLDEARDAYALALALDPDDPETLAGAADLYVNHLPPTNANSAIGLAHARRGERLAEQHKNPNLVGRLALLAGEALNDLGRPGEALAELEKARRASPEEPQIDHELGVASFELCRFPEARRRFEAVLARSPGDAWARQHLGLTLERLGDEAGGEREMARARQLAPADFPPPVILPSQEFRELVVREAASLPPPMLADLARVRLDTADLPDVADLTAEDPPLSPTILGLFRGVPLCDPGSEAAEHTIILFRKNLGRAVRTRQELQAQVRTTLFHELGHLRGEDDEELRARGLE